MGDKYNILPELCQVIFIIKHKLPKTWEHDFLPSGQPMVSKH